MEQLNITQIQRACVNDGPGVRTTVFLKGCIFQCPWCCNPETISNNTQFFTDWNRCNKLKHHSLVCKTCENSQGNRSVLECPFRIVEPVSKYYSHEELYNEIIKDESLYNETGGGVTFSGGEPLLQIKKLIPILVSLKEKNGISIYFESTVAVSPEFIQQAIDYMDGIFIDLKLQPEMGLLENDNYKTLIAHNIEILESKSIDIVYRIVFVESLLDHFDSFFKMLCFWNINKIELLKCHNLGVSKYKKMGLHFIDYTPTEESFLTFKDNCIKRGLECNCLSV